MTVLLTGKIAKAAMYERQVTRTLDIGLQSGASDNSKTTRIP